MLAARRPVICGQSAESLRKRERWKGIKNAFPLGKPKPDPDYASLESCCSNSSCLKHARRQCIPATGEGTEGTEPASTPRWPCRCGLSRALLPSVPAMRCWGKIGPFFFSGANSARQREQLLRKLFGEAGDFGHAAGSQTGSWGTLGASLRCLSHRSRVPVSCAGR